MGAVRLRSKLRSVVGRASDFAASAMDVTLHLLRRKPVRVANPRDSKPTGVEHQSTRGSYRTLEGGS